MMADALQAGWFWMEKGHSCTREGVGVVWFVPGGWTGWYFNQLGIGAPVKSTLYSSVDEAIASVEAAHIFSTDKIP